MSIWSSFYLVFSNKYHIAIAAAVAAIFWIVMNVIDQLLFFWPVVDFYLPRDKLFDFAITNIAAALMGVVVSMNIFALRMVRRVSGSLFSGSALGVASCACAGCSSLGLFIVPIFGSVGAAALAFLITYQIFFRLISIGILVWAFYSAHRLISINSYRPSQGTTL
jgi:hypothetical protein